MNNFALLPLLKASWETIYMVFLASFMSIIFGLGIGILLFVSAKKQAWENKFIHQTLGLIVNITRSIPFIILLIAIIPLTRLLIGTSIGTNAAVVPLTLAAIPFFARICEAAFTEVPYGLIEAAHAMGASNWQIIYKVVIPESLTSLIKGATLTIIGLIGYSAMAGAVGGGGLGELAINYGYQRFNLPVMIETVVVLVLIVQIVQLLGDYLARSHELKWVSVFSIVFLVIAFVVQAWPSTPAQKSLLRVGVMSGISEKIMEVAKQVAAEKYDLQIKVVTFNDYIQPNLALQNGDIDANIFQHEPYLQAQNSAQHLQLSPIAKTFVYPLGFYSSQITKLEDLAEGSIIALPNDPSNQWRALLLLAKHHLIELNPKASTIGSLRDVIANPHNFHFKALDAAQLPRTLKDAALVALTNDYTGPAGFTVKNALILEGDDSPYANIIVTRAQDKNLAVYQKLIQAMHSPEVVQATAEAFPEGAAIPAWQ